MDNCPIAAAVRGKCPFLHGLAQAHGETFARNIAVNPLLPASANEAHSQPGLAELGSFANTLALFHGKDGVHPLPKFQAPQSAVDDAAPKVLHPPSADGCPFAASKGSPYHVPAATSQPVPNLTQRLAKAPLASLSMSSFGGNWPDFHQFFKERFQQHRHGKKPPQQQQRKPQARAGPSTNAAGAALGPTANAPNLAGQQCPLRKALGPFAGAIFNKQGHLACPEPIMKMRAALAATKPVRELRPQALPVKFIAMGAVTALLNVPCGMWREHTEKFSTGWFIAVHATIPFIAMLRKAVIMPKYAILFTVAAAIAGQAIGARLERQRITAAATEGSEQLVRARPVVKAPSPSAARGSGSRRYERPLPMACMATAGASHWDSSSVAEAVSSAQQLLLAGQASDVGATAASDMAFGSSTRRKCAVRLRKRGLHAHPLPSIGAVEAS